MRLRTCIILLAATGLFVSCGSVKDIYGKYGSSTCTYTFSPSGTFEYEFHDWGFWGWSKGKWERIAIKRYRLVSVRHDSIPLLVTEEQTDSNHKTIILSEASDWDTNFFVMVNGKSYKLPKNDRILILADTQIETISLVSFTEEKINRWEIPHSFIKTDVYCVKDRSNNVFRISLPDNKSLEDYYRLEEFDETLKIRKKVLIRNGYYYDRVRN